MVIIEKEENITQGGNKMNITPKIKALIANNETNWAMHFISKNYTQKKNFKTVC